MANESKVVIVTGASQGIGAALVEGYRGRGYRVVANSRTIADNVAAGDPDVAIVVGDIGQRSTAEQIVAVALERFGRIDTLVNNAGIFIPKPFVDYSVVDFNAVLSVNIAGFFHISQLAIAEMVKRGSGHVVNITAALAEQPSKAVSAALASLTKGGLNAVTLALAVEFADRGIRVNAVAPGVIKTPMHSPQANQFLASLNAQGRLGEVQDIADAVLYLESASFVTGEILHVDGGQHLGH